MEDERAALTAELNFLGDASIGVKKDRPAVESVNGSTSQRVEANGAEKLGASALQDMLER